MSEPTSASTVQVPGTDLPRITDRVIETPAGRAIGGASSGAICAFTVAWERPNEFRRVAKELAESSK